MARDFTIGSIHRLGDAVRLLDAELPSPLPPTGSGATLVKKNTRDGMLDLLRLRRELVLALRMPFQTPAKKAWLLESALEVLGLDARAHTAVGVIQDLRDDELRTLARSALMAVL